MKTRRVASDLRRRSPIAAAAAAAAQRQIHAEAHAQQEREEREERQRQMEMQEQRQQQEKEAQQPVEEGAHTEAAATAATGIAAAIQAPTGACEGEQQHTKAALTQVPAQQQRTKQM